VLPTPLEARPPAPPDPAALAPPPVPAPPPFAPETTAVPAIDAQLDVELQKNVSPPALPLLEVPVAAAAPAAPTEKETAAPGANETLSAIEYAPPPPAPAGKPPPPLFVDPAPPPAPIVSIELSELFQLFGTVQLERPAAVMTTVCCTV
jgi:hypothetical protein